MNEETLGISHSLANTICVGYVNPLKLVAQDVLLHFLDSSFSTKSGFDRHSTYLLHQSSFGILADDILRMAHCKVVLAFLSLSLTTTSSAVLGGKILICPAVSVVTDTGPFPFWITSQIGLLLCSYMVRLYEEFVWVGVYKISVLMVEVEFLKSSDSLEGPEKLMRSLQPKRGSAKEVNTVSPKVNSVRPTSNNLKVYKHNGSYQSCKWEIGDADFKTVNMFIIGGTLGQTSIITENPLRTSDNGTEFKNRDMLEIYGNKGVKQEYSNARTPQQNGVAERMNRTLIEAARTMLADSLLPTTFWLKPLDTLHLKKPNVKGVGYRWMFDIDYLTDSMNYIPVSLENQANNAGNVPKNNTTSTHSVNTGSQTVNTGRLDHDDSLMPELEIFHKPETGIFDEASYDEEGVITDFNSLPTEIEVSPTPTLRIHKKPKKIAEALQDDSWVQAMQEELYNIQATKPKKNKKDIMLVQVYVDDIIFGSTNKSWCDEFEALMQSDPNEVPWLQSTPMKDKLPLTKDEEAFDVDVTQKTSHLNAVKRIFKYLKGKPNLGLWYPRESPFDLEAFSDSDYGGSNLDRKSTTGGCQFLGQRLISWQCKKQTTVATSTTEAKYVAAANCCRQYCDKHNQVGFLRKPNESAGFAEIVDFLRGSNLRYALTANPTIYDSLVKQFWQSAIANTRADGSLEINATIDTIRYTISEASIRDSLQLDDATGITMLPNADLFEGMGQIGYPTDGTFTFWKSFFTPQWRYLVHHLLHCISSKSGGWDQFGSNIATALICLSTGRVYNFSKLIFDGMVANLKNKKKFLMYPRFLQMILNIQTENKHPYLAVSLTKKIFGNMKRGFQGAPRPLLPSMLLVATNPNAGQEHAAQAQSQPSPTPPPIPTSTSPPPPIPSPTPPPIPTPTPPPIPTPTSPPPPPPETEPTTDEYIYEEQSPVHHHFSPSQEQAPSLQTVPKLISRLDSLELDLKQTKLTMGNVIVKLVKKVNLTKARRYNEKKRVYMQKSSLSLDFQEDNTVLKRLICLVRLMLLVLKLIMLVKLILRNSKEDKGTDLTRRELACRSYKIGFLTKTKDAEQIHLDALSCTKGLHKKKNWDLIRAKLEANAELSKSMLGSELQGKDFAKEMVDLVNQRKKFFAEERAKAKRNKPMTQSQLKTYMMNYLKNQGSWKLNQLRKLSFEEVKEEFDKLIKQIDSFVPISFEATKDSLKRFGEELQTKTPKRLKEDKDG
ncbi:putative ribonuclease H-like domain-containing protein [Tanacetum coccineum]|uniref:Ribonuclease H-like domain-containing protein n=1 Tax=Tanacetum coccineum TaxID=301880 RepID=A0ABQ5FTX3_9ASTR